MHNHDAELGFDITPGTASQESGHSTRSGSTPRIAADDPELECRHDRFNALLAVHLPALARVAFRLCRHREWSEELVQETVLRAWKHIDQLRDEAAAKTWLFMILRREHARSYRRSSPVQVDIEPDLLPDGRYEPCTNTMALRQAVEALPEKYRSPLMLFAYAGYRMAEIAADLGIGVNTVNTRVFRARKRLRDCLLHETTASA